MLGAIRHRGFVPWDDDADVIMNREMYEKFVAVVDKELDSERFYFQDIDRTPGYRWGYGKMRRKGTTFLREHQEKMPYEQGVFMDVFVCDNVPDYYPLRCIVNFQSYLLRKAFYSVIGVENSRGLSKVVYSFLSRIKEEKLKEIYHRFVKKLDARKTHFVKCITFPACNKTYGYKRSWYEDTIDIPFCGVILKGARDYDEYLRFLYGEYMKLPPIEKRKCHPVSKIQLLKDQNGDESL